MIEHVGSGELDENIIHSFSIITVAFFVAVILGTLAGALIHRSRRGRDVADPLLASSYSAPTFIFYPLLVALLGLTTLTEIADMSPRFPTQPPCRSWWAPAPTTAIP